MRNLVATLVLAIVILALQSVAQPAQAAGYGRCGGCGTVLDVDPIYYDRRDRGTEGAIVGAIIGGAIGNQVGRGDGRTAATVAGAIAGGLIGRKADRRGGGRGERGLRLELRMDSGGYRTIEVGGGIRLYRGDRVQIRRGRVELLR